MPTPPNAPELIGGPYRPPRCKIGKPVYDLLHGDLVVVAISDAPIPWPMIRTHPNSRGTVPAMTADLKRAVERESVEAIAHHWQTSRWTVRRWRHALGVDRFNEGTRRLWSQLAETRLGDHRGTRPGSPAPVKLTAEQRAELTRRARAGESCAALAREMGVTRQYVSQLRREG